MSSTSSTPRPLHLFTLIPKLCLPSTSWQNLKEALADAISNRCSSPKHLHSLHAQSISSGLHSNPFISTRLITKYFHFGDPQSAHKLFNRLKLSPAKPLVWNTLIRGYLKIGLPSSALDVFNQMASPDARSFHLALTACSQLSDLDSALRVEELVRSNALQCDLLIATALINLHSQCGDTETARYLFDEMPIRDAVAWNAMMSAYSHAGCSREALNLFKSMRDAGGIQLTEGSLVSVVTGCQDLVLVRDGQSMHAHVIRTGFQVNVNVSNSLMAMYVGCGSLDAAEKVFDGMPLKDEISWSTMIGGYVKHGRGSDALDLFRCMVSEAEILPTRPILLSVLRACADLGDWLEGQRIEQNYLVNENGGFVSDAHLITELMYMHAKCGHMAAALQILDKVVLVREDAVAWNVMIKACVEQKQDTWVFELTREMQRRGIRAEAITFLTLLSVISAIPLPRKGMETHAQIIRKGFESEQRVANSLIDMYARCGIIGDSFKVFKEIHVKDVVSWSLMIKAYAWNGNAKEALSLFYLMRKARIQPNLITFLGVLSACCHAGYVDEGWRLFELMKEHGIEPNVEYFACMVDMFCRAGLLNVVYGLLKNSMQKHCTNVVVWGTLLSACRMHGDLVIGEKAARQLFLMEPRNAANYLMLADIYISAGWRDEANRVLALLRENGVDRRAGCTWFNGC